ncbi:sensor domain-containing diguanylate cyclase [Dechloromonas sp. A34]|uniref:sensor domain-containing diguanylate cyclase n=1 Tax=Dechloromonas sp. A34 TaxID=447588 RepID=UPI002248FC76|nr:sensor domain-containing diguanylate cyclase [Dechloromonas sp. A34]
MIGCTVPALQLSSEPPSLRRLLGAAGLLTASALLAPLVGALADAAGPAWVESPDGLALAALLAFAAVLTALALLARRPPVLWRSSAANLLLTTGWLLPQFMHLAHWPALASRAMAVDGEGLAWLAAFDTLAVIGLFLFSRHLTGRALLTGQAEIAALRAADAELASRLQVLDQAKLASIGQHERRCDQLLQSANVAVFDWDLLSGKVDYGGAWSCLLGHDDPHCDWLRQARDPLTQLCHPRELGQAQRLLRELASGERDRVHCEVRLRSASGAWLWVLVHAQVVERQPDGSPRRIVGTQLDISRTKRVEHLLFAERRLFASGPVIVLTFDAEAPHRLRQASSNLHDALGQTEPHPAAGQPLDALVHDDDAPRLAESVRSAVARPGAQAQCEVRLAKADGSWPWYLLHVVAERQNLGKLLRAYLVDINGLKEAESHAAEHNTALQQVVHKMGETQQFMESLQQLTELLQLCESEAESEQIIVQGGPQLFPRWSGALTFADNGGLMTVAASWGESFTVQHAMEADCWAVRRGRLHQSSIEPDQHVLSPVCSHFGGDRALPPGIKHTICAPLLKSFDRPGVLHLVAYETMDEEALQSAAWGAETFADALKLSLGNLRLRISLREQAVHDEMTDLYNRRYFDEALNRERSRSERTGEGLILAMLDIDHFKNFNDNFGHEAGDEVLKKVAEHLRHFVRAYDIACRVGGEELAILMPRVHIDEAVARLNQLREEIGACTLNHKGTQLPAVTVSIGVADLDTDAPDDLLRRADSALYAAKNSGRNRVKRWTAELETDVADGADRNEPAVPAGPTGETKRTAPADRSATAANGGARTNGKESGTDAPAGRSARNGGQDGGHHERSEL